MKAVFGDTRLPLRFWDKVAVQPSGCWAWAGSIDWSGYGQFWMDGSTLGAHRACYLILIGLIPEGCQIDHLCRVRHCVNPSHMEAVTSRENTLRGETLPAINAAKTHCQRGHIYDSVNTFVAGGRRYCRGCGAIRQANYRQRLKEKANEV